MKKLRQFVITSVLWTVAAASAAESNDQLAVLEMAAQHGDPAAQTELAVRYEHAEGVPKDFKKAYSLYCQAAKQGYAEAQFKLGWVYANGRGVARDSGIAAALFVMAAEQGDEHAAKLLQYVRPQPDTELPRCLLPDSPPRLVADQPVELARSGLAGGGDEHAAELLQYARPQPDTELPQSLLLDSRARSVTDQPVELARSGVVGGGDETAIPGVRSDIKKIVYQLSPQYSVDPKLVLAVISVESGFQPVAVSPKNAQGLMQLIPATAERFGVKKAFDVVENIKGGLAYLRWLLAFFQGDVPLVLAAYNAGEGTVEKYRGIPPYAETRDYVKKISSLYKNVSHPYDFRVVKPSTIKTRVKRPWR